jgi:Uri superfamily endonuclease
MRFTLHQMGAPRCGSRKNVKAFHIIFENRFTSGIYAVFSSAQSTVLGRVNRAFTESPAK